jgi:hypothetical protein
MCRSRWWRRQNRPTSWNFFMHHQSTRGHLDNTLMNTFIGELTGDLQDSFSSTVRLAVALVPQWWASTHAYCDLLTS